MSTRAIVALGLALAVAGARAGAQEATHRDSASGAIAVGTQRVEVTRRVLVAPGMSLDDARRRAIDDAQAEAVREVVGTQVDAVQLASRTERGQTLDDAFSSIVQASASGRVTAYTITRDTVEQTRDASGRPLYYLVLVLLADVTPEEGRPDPGFRVSLELNQPVFTDGGPGHRDEIIARVRVTKDAYVTLFQVSGDSVQLLLPNQWVRANHVLAGQSMEFPPADLRSGIGLHLLAEVPPGATRTTERLTVVATKRPVPFTGALGTSTEPGVVNTIQGTLVALQRWLVNIPLSERAESDILYETRRVSNP